MKDKYKTDRAIWHRMSFLSDAFDPEAEKLSDRQREFLYNMFDENLEHARHIENERITFNSIFIALAAGVLAFLSSISEFGIKLGLLILLFLMGIIAMLLTYRWNNAFNRHTYFAKKCYTLLHMDVFPISGKEEYEDEQPTKANKYGAELVDVQEMINGLSEAPAYCFRPKDPITEESNIFKKLIHDKLKTQQMFNLFYVILQIAILVIIVITIMGEMQ